MSSGCANCFGRGPGRDRVPAKARRKGFKGEPWGMNILVGDIFFGHDLGILMSTNPFEA